MELVNKVLQGYVDGELKDIAPSTRQDNVFLSTNQSILCVSQHFKHKFIKFLFYKGR